MTTNHPIKTVVDAMLEYQEKNNITQQCMTNAQYLYDFIIHNYPELNPKTKAVIAMSQEDDTITIVYGHMIVGCLENGRGFEASYEINSKPNVRYYDTIPQLLKILPGFKMNKDQLGTFINFTSISNRINNNKDVCVADMTFYNNQADYVENIVKEKYGDLIK